MVAAMVLGIIGGVVGLLVGLAGYVWGSFHSWAATQSGSGGGYGLFLQVVSIALPIASIVGGGVVKQNALLAGVLMGVSALGMVFVFGIDVFTILAVALSGTGAVIALTQTKTAKPPATT